MNSDINLVNDSIELELTYLAAYIPDEVMSVTPVRIRDIYIPDRLEVHPRLRLRQSGDKCELTKKTPLISDDASAHRELTIPLTQDEFKSLAKSSNRVVEKDRYAVNLAGRMAEIDVFTGDLAGLVLIDFEFDNPNDKGSFIPPDICLANVTQEEFIAGGRLAGLSYSDIEVELEKFNYVKLDRPSIVE